MTPLRTASAPNKDRWLLSYADLLTLLLAFFVVMYSVSAVDVERLSKVSAGLDVAFNTTPTSAAISDSLTQISSAPAVPAVQSLAAWLPDAFVVTAESAEWFEFSIGASLLFGAGSATLSVDTPVIDLLPVLRLSSGDIVVEGHTDDLPIATEQYPSNWELSAARAAAVVRILEGQGLAAQRLAALGLGASRPVASNETDTGRALNRRVIIKIRQQGFDPSGLVAGSAVNDEVPASDVVPTGIDPVSASAADAWLDDIDPSMLKQVLDDMDKQEAPP